MNSNEILNLLWIGYCTSLTCFTCAELELSQEESKTWLNDILNNNCHLSHYIDDKGFYQPCLRETYY